MSQYPPPRTGPHGWLILDKPVGLGSTQAVGAVKRVCREAGYGKIKVGHGGTLDPLAEGVLPIALGEATKLAGRMLDADKIYAFTVKFGEETDTLDTEGAVVGSSDVRPSLAEVEAVLGQFTGPIQQMPPKYSALKVGGRRAYDLARAGEEVELATRAVTIHSLKILPGTGRGTTEGGGGASPNPSPSGKPLHHPADGPPPPVGEEWAVTIHSLTPLPLGGGAGGGESPLQATFDPEESPHPQPLPLEGRGPLDEITLEAHVSKGTYIRSLARDIAYALGTVGHVTYLRRTKAGPFTHCQAISLDLLNEIGKGAPLEDHLLPLEVGLDGIPALTLNPESAQAVRQGRIISGLPHADGLLLAKLADVPVALMEVSAGTATVVRGFNIPDTAE